MSEHDEKEPLDPFTEAAAIAVAEIDREEARRKPPENDAGEPDPQPTGADWRLFAADMVDAVAGVFEKVVPDWDPMEEQERERMIRTGAPVLEKYCPAILAEYVIEIAFGLAVWAYAAPRIKPRSQRKVVDVPASREPEYEDDEYELD